MDTGRHNRGKLDKGEFSVAMHLIYRKLNGYFSIRISPNASTTPLQHYQCPLPTPAAIPTTKPLHRQGAVIWR